MTMPGLQTVLGEPLAMAAQGVEGQPLLGEEPQRQDQGTPQETSQEQPPKEGRPDPGLGRQGLSGHG